MLKVDEVATTDGDVAGAVVAAAGVEVWEPVAGLEELGVVVVDVVVVDFAVMLK